MNSTIAYPSSADCLSLITPSHFYNSSIAAGTFPVLWQMSYFFMSSIAAAVWASLSVYFVPLHIFAAGLITLAVSSVTLIVTTIESSA